jgi:hypothetical protein
VDVQRAAAMNVVVTGMGRSGTSAVAHALGLLGFDVGPFGASMAADEFNATGYWEVPELSDFNDALLKRAGGSWSAPPRVVGSEPEPGDPMAEAARERFAHCFPGSAPWVWKDPRLCLTLPFWRQILDPPLAVVAMLRHPVAVAQSLAHRDHAERDYARAMWERYTRSLVASAQGLPTIFVDYNQLVGDPTKVMRQLAAWLRVDPSRVPAAAESIRSDLSHYVGDDALLSDAERALWGFMRDQIGFHATLSASPSGPESPWLQLTFDEHARAQQIIRSFRLDRAALQESLAALDYRRSETEAELGEVRLRLNQILESRTWRRLSSLRRLYLRLGGGRSRQASGQ